MLNIYLYAFYISIWKFKVMIIVLTVHVITLFHDRVYTILNTLTHTDKVYTSL